MRRWLYIATFSLMLFALPVWAQRGGGHAGGGGHFGGGGGGHAASHGSFSSHSSGSVHTSSAHAYSAHGSSALSSLRSVNSGRGAGINLRIGNRFYPSRGVYGRRSYYPYYRYGAYYPYYGWYADPLYDTNDQDLYADEYQPAPYREDSGVQRNLDLQTDADARHRPKPDVEPATALVFRDQHVEEVRSYAISGGMLWVINEQAAKKIPLAQLDIPATVKLNDDRGVDFQVPGPALSLSIVR